MSVLPANISVQLHQRTESQAIVQNITSYFSASPQDMFNMLTSPTMASRALQLPSRCSLPGCITPAFFDQQIQEQRDYCQEHMLCVPDPYKDTAPASELLPI